MFTRAENEVAVLSSKLLLVWEVGGLCWLCVFQRALLVDLGLSAITETMAMSHSSQFIWDYFCNSEEALL